jgi:hypothetical protein
MEANGAVQNIFRAMKEDRDGYPLTGSSSRTLGVRIDGPSTDILVAPDGTVSPGVGGMSVALDAARNLPKHRLPKSRGGEGRDPVVRDVVRGAAWQPVGTP